MDILKLKIKHGEYRLGQTVVPQNFTKTAIKRWQDDYKRGVRIWMEISLRSYVKKSYL